MSQTFEFTGAFPAGWQTYSAISQTIGTVTFGDYSWSTTAYTKAEGMRSAIAMLGGVGGSVLTDTAVYTAPVDSWLVYGPVSLAAVWQARLDFQYLYTTPLTSSARLTVAVSTNYDPISRTGTFAGQAVTPTDGWTAGTLDLSPYTGQTVYIAFHYQSSDGGTVSNGPFVDDVHLRANYRMLLPLVAKWTLALSKSASASSVLPGQSIVYTIRVDNTGGSDAPGIVLSDPVPTGMTFVGADGAFNFFNGVVTWPNLTAPAGGSVFQHFTVTVPSGTSSGYKVVNQDYSISVPPDPRVLFGVPVTTTVAGEFFDDFTNPASGWPVGEFDPANAQCYPNVPAPGSWRAGYLPSGGGYGVTTACDRAAQLYSAPARLADTRNFTIEADLRSNQDVLWASSYGIFFNGIEDLHEVYTARLYQGQDPPEWDLRYWSNFNWSDKYWPPAEILQFGTCYMCNGADFAWNHMVVQRTGNVIEVWLGFDRSHMMKVSTTDGRATGSQYNRVGFLHDNFEWNYAASGPGQYAYVFNSFRLSPAVR